MLMTPAAHRTGRTRSAREAARCHASCFRGSQAHLHREGLAVSQNARRTFPSEPPPSDPLPLSSVGVANDCQDTCPKGGEKRSKSAVPRLERSFSSFSAVPGIWYTRTIDGKPEKATFLVFWTLVTTSRSSERVDLHLGFQNSARYLAETLSFGGCQIVVIRLKLGVSACYLDI